MYRCAHCLKVLLVVNGQPQPCDDHLEGNIELVE